MRLIFPVDVVAFLEAPLERDGHFDHWNCLHCPVAVFGREPEQGITRR